MAKWPSIRLLAGLLSGSLPGKIWGQKANLYETLNAG